jgi:hypothetical protein
MLHEENAVFMDWLSCFWRIAPAGKQKGYDQSKISSLRKNIEIRCKYFSFSLNGLFFV